MKITKAGVYVMVMKFGIEGLLQEDDNSKIQIDSEKEEAHISING